MKLRIILLTIFLLIIIQSGSVYSQDDLNKSEYSGESSIISIGTPNFPIVFEGKDDVTNPPDLSIAAGPKSIITVSNGWVTAYDKSTTNELWSRNPRAFLFELNQNAIIADPHVIYDMKNNRFIIMYLSVNFVDRKSEWVVAISDNDNPDSSSSAWCYYHLNQRIYGGVEEDLAGDFPSMNVDWTNDIIHFTVAMFPIVNGYFGPNIDHMRIRTLKLSGLYNCGDPVGFDTKLYRDSDREVVPVIQPAQAYTKSDTSYFISNKIDTPPVAGEGKLVIWKVPATSTLSSFSDQIIAVDPRYEAKRNIRQKSGLDLKVTDARILQAIYRNNILWFTHNVLSTIGADSSVRTYKYDIGASTMTTIRREAAGIDFSVPGIAVNQFSEALTIFNRSSPNEFISIRVAGFDTNSNELQPGLGTITPNTVWGDYARSTIDPNGTDFWIAHHYAKADGSGGIKIAGTRIRRVFIPAIIK